MEKNAVEARRRINEALSLVKQSKDQDNFQTHQDIFLTTCKIECGLLCAEDSLDHVADEIGEGTISAGVQISIIKGAIALIQQQISTLAEMRNHITTAFALVDGVGL